MDRPPGRHLGVAVVLHGDEADLPAVELEALVEVALEGAERAVGAVLVLPRLIGDDALLRRRSAGVEPHRDADLLTGDASISGTAVVTQEGRRAGRGVDRLDLAG